MNADERAVLAAAECGVDGHGFEEIVTMCGEVVARICTHCGHRERTDP